MRPGHLLQVLSGNDVLLVNKLVVRGLNVIKRNECSISVGGPCTITVDGDHGIAILTARGELGLMNDVKSDCASLYDLIDTLQAQGISMRMMRDATRGGLATTLVEICEDFNITMELDEDHMPVDDRVHGACELLGYEPMYLANEGKCIFVVPQEQCEKALEIMKAHPLGQNASQIGEVIDTENGKLLLKTVFGSSRRLNRLSGMLLPRIC